MSQQTRKEVLPRMRQRYKDQGIQGKILLINELCEQWKYSRRHAIELLNGRVGCEKKVLGKKVDLHFMEKKLNGFRKQLSSLVERDYQQ